MFAILGIAACDRSPPRGPCSSTGMLAGWGPLVCVAEHDDAGRRVRTTCTVDYGYELEIAYTYDGDELVGVTLDENDAGAAGASQTWNFGADVVTVESRTYFYDSGSSSETTSRLEREGLVLHGHPDDLEAWPTAPDALLDLRRRATDSDGNTSMVEIAFEYDGPPRQGTRTRTGDDGSVAVFRYDDLGRLVESEGTAYIYDGSRLTATDGDPDWRDWTFEYDGDGNLVRKRNGDGDVTEYTPCR